MMNYTVTKDFTSAKAKTTAKADIVAKIIEFLKAEFGDENVGMVRIGNTSKSNEIGAIVAEVATGGETKSMAVTINVTAKEFEDGKTSTGKAKFAFDFAAARAEYDEYVAEKEAKAADKAKAKAEKIAKDEAARKAKAEAKAKEAEGETEDEGIEEVADF